MTSSSAEKRSAIARGASRLAQATAAAVILVVLCYVGVVIIANAESALAVRTDRPAIIEVTGQRCEPYDARLVARPWQGYAWRKFPLCDDPKLTTTAPAGEFVSLFVNGRLDQTTAPRGAVAEFRNIQLEPGLNQLTVVGQSDRANGSRQQYAANRDGLSPSRWRGLFGGWSSLSAQATVLGDLPAPPAVPIASWELEGQRMVLFQGAAGSIDRRNDFGLIQTDGFAVEPLEPQAPVPPTPPLTMHRKLDIVREPSGRMTATGDFCLPAGNPLLSIASRLDPATALERLAGVRLFGLEGGPPQGSVEMAADPQGCTNLHVTLQAERAYAYTTGSATFPTLPGDQLVATGVEPSSLRGAPPPAVDGDDRRTWTGPLSRSVSIMLASRLEAPVAPQETASSQPVAVGGPAAGEIHSPTIGEAFHSIPVGLPAVLSQAAGQLGRLFPIALIYWALARAVRGGFHGQLARRAKTAAGFLLGITAVLSLRAPLLGLAAWCLSRSSLVGFRLDAFGGDETYGARLYAPVVMAAAFAAPALLKGQLKDGPELRRGPASLLAALISLLGVVAAAPILLFQHAPWGEPDRPQPDLASLVLAEAPHASSTWAPVLGALVWSAIAPISLAAAAYWLGRAISRHGHFAFSALFAGVAIYLLQLAPALADWARVRLALAIGPESVWGPLAHANWTAAVVPSITLFLVAFALLGVMAQIALILAPRPWTGRVRAWTRPHLVALAALVLTAPWMAGLRRAPLAVSDQIVAVGDIIQAACVLLALIAGVIVILLGGPRRAAADQATPARLTLLSAIFGAYVSLWCDDAVAAVMVGLAALALFRWWVLDGRTDPISPADRADLTQRILDYRSGMRLLASRRKAMEDKFAKAEIADADLTAERKQMARIQARIEAALGLPLRQAKRRLFGAGPEPTPLRNALLGAAAGLGGAIVMQMLLPFQSLLQPDRQKGWMGYLIGAPFLHVVDLPGQAPGYLRIAALIVNITAIWVMTGFLFGFCFRRIRGDDGVVKGAVFAAAVALPYLANVGLLRGGPASAGDIAPLAPLVVFILVLGALVFDCRTLMNSQVSPGKLPAVYGYSTSVGYVSIAGMIASIQPVFAFLKTITGR